RRIPRSELQKRLNPARTVILTCGNPSLMADIRYIADRHRIRFERKTGDILPHLTQWRLAEQPRIWIPHNQSEAEPSRELHYSLCQRRFRVRMCFLVPARASFSN